MECFYCKGEMEEGKVPYTIRRKGYYFVAEDVPAFVCRQCGEPYFEDKEVDFIQMLIKDLDKKTREIQQMHLQPVSSF